MSAPLLFRAERIAKRFGGFTALDSVDFLIGTPNSHFSEGGFD